MAVYYFARIFVSDESAGYASLLSVFLPSIGQAAYYSGQLTTLFGLVSSLFAAVCLHRFLKSGRGVDFASTVSLTGVAISSHHFSALFFLPVCLLLSTVTILLRSSHDLVWRKVVSRLVLISAVAGLVCFIVVYPFWLFLLGEKMQTPIHHGSRELFSGSWADVYFWNIHGIFLVFVPLTCLFALKYLRTFPLFSSGFFMFMMGLGGITPLPLIFGEWGQWLVYDRFALWAGILFLPMAGLILRVAKNRLTRFKLGKLLLVGFIVSLAVNCWWVSNLTLYFGHPREVAVEETKAFLDEGDNWRWRYLTLGFGEAQLARLSMMVNATTLDGTYYTARTLPVLRDSGLGTIDSAKYSYELLGERGLTLLNNVLSDASSFSLKWVFCTDSFYEPILEAHGFSRLHTLSDGVTTVWSLEGVPMLGLDVFERSETSLTGLVWGAAPMLCLFFAVCSIHSYRKDFGISL